MGNNLFFLIFVTFSEYLNFSNFSTKSQNLERVVFKIRVVTFLILFLVTNFAPATKILNYNQTYDIWSIPWVLQPYVCYFRGRTDVPLHNCYHWLRFLPSIPQNVSEQKESSAFKNSRDIHKWLQQIVLCLVKKIGMCRKIFKNVLVK